MTRADAFRKPLPSDWKPTVGDKVFVREIPKTLARHASRAVVTCVLLAEQYEVIVTCGKREAIITVDLDSLRPLPARKGKP